MKPEEIRARREHLKLTQKQLGAAFGVTWNTIARWERVIALDPAGEYARRARRDVRTASDLQGIFSAKGG